MSVQNLYLHSHATGTSPALQYATSDSDGKKDCVSVFVAYCKYWTGSCESYKCAKTHDKTFEHSLLAKKASTNRADPDQTAFEEAV